MRCGARRLPTGYFPVAFAIFTLSLGVPTVVVQQGDYAASKHGAPRARPV
jgi:hypothetical protein